MVISDYFNTLAGMCLNLELKHTSRKVTNGGFKSSNSAFLYIFSTDLAYEIEKPMFQIRCDLIAKFN